MIHGGKWGEDKLPGRDLRLHSKFRWLYLHVDVLPKMHLFSGKSFKWIDKCGSGVIWDKCRKILGSFEVIDVVQIL